MSNQEIPHNATVRIFGKLIKKAYTEKILELEADGSAIQRHLERINPGKEYFDLNKNAVLTAIATMESTNFFAQELLDIGEINIPITIANIVELTSLSNRTVLKSLKSLEFEGYINSILGDTCTFRLSNKTKEKLKS
jgi:hypothetical protein